LLAVPTEQFELFLKEAPHMGVDAWLIGELQADQAFILN